MVGEKIAKAYLWRAVLVPEKTHTGFATFLRALALRADPDIRAAFGFPQPSQFQAWIRANLDLAYRIERLAPALAQDGPNPEYPWPHKQPQYTPANYDFPIWNELIGTSRGRKFLQAVKLAVREFPRLA
jgi:hypothetical protein